MTNPTADDDKMLRYLGFLAQEWPRLAQTALVPPSERPVTRSRVLEHTVGVLGDREGLRLEFGVWRGESIRRCAAQVPSRHWYGFDSFEGFPDDGRIDWQKPFKVIEMPDTPGNVTLVKGYFSDTLDPFLKATPGELAFVNVDCDIYSSTVDIFTALERHDRLRPGLVIFFDELVNYADYMWNESLALFEMLERTGFGVKWICVDQHLRLPGASTDLFLDGSHPTWMEDMQSGHWMQASCVLTDTPIDCGPMDDPAYRASLVRMLAGLRKREAARSDAALDRQRRLEQMAEEREAREIERRRRDRERAERQAEERRRAREAAKAAPARIVAPVADAAEKPENEDEDEAFALIPLDDETADAPGGR